MLVLSRPAPMQTGREDQRTSERASESLETAAAANSVRQGPAQLNQQTSHQYLIIFPNVPLIPPPSLCWNPPSHASMLEWLPNEFLNSSIPFVISHRAMGICTSSHLRAFSSISIIVHQCSSILMDEGGGRPGCRRIYAVCINIRLCLPACDSFTEIRANPL